MTNAPNVLNFEEKQHNLGLPTFKLPTSSKYLLRLTRYIFFGRFQYM